MTNEVVIEVVEEKNGGLSGMVVDNVHKVFLVGLGAAASPKTNYSIWSINSSNKAKKPKRKSSIPSTTWLMIAKKKPKKQTNAPRKNSTNAWKPFCIV
ncbi:MAG: hypothetical protein IPJ94_30595 [Chloroflexi bacterium]|nr:hypothetical protein [Chloroflexota bacterium]